MKTAEFFLFIGMIALPILAIAIALFTLITTIGKSFCELADSWCRKNERFNNIWMTARALRKICVMLIIIIACFSGLYYVTTWIWSPMIASFNGDFSNIFLLLKFIAYALLLIISVLLFAIALQIIFKHCTTNILDVIKGKQSLKEYWNNLKGWNSFKEYHSFHFSNYDDYL